MNVCPVNSKQRKIEDDMYFVNVSLKQTSAVEYKRG